MVIAELQEYVHYIVFHMFHNTPLQHGNILEHIVIQQRKGHAKIV